MSKMEETLFLLIKSMTKAEKRNFKIYANRALNSKETKFIRLFDLIDKQQKYDEKQLLKSAKEIKPAQLPNLKAHLYKQIMTSLRLLHTHYDVHAMIREQIDCAKILFSKGLVKQSLKTLKKAKKNAQKYHNNGLELSIVNFEKHISSLYANSEISMAELLAQSLLISNRVANATRLSNLVLSLYSVYLKTGYEKREDYGELELFFQEELEGCNMESLSFTERLYLYQAHVWLSLIKQDFNATYYYSNELIVLFQQDDVLIDAYPDFYLRCLNNVLTSFFFKGNAFEFQRFLELLKELHHRDTIFKNYNTSVLLRNFTFTHQLNACFLTGDFAKASSLIPDIEDFLETYKHLIDSHRLLIFYYKLACVCFGNGEFKRAIFYLNQVINISDTSLRGDLHCYARVLNLISHFELGNHDLLDYQILSTYRFLIKKNKLQKVQKHILKFLRKTYVDDSDLMQAFKKSRDYLADLKDDPIEKRAFLYIDFIAWLDSKIQKRPVAEIVKENVLKKL